MMPVCADLSTHLVVAKPVIGFAARCQRKLVACVQLQRCSAVDDGLLQAHNVTALTALNFD